MVKTFYYYDEMVNMTGKHDDVDMYYGL